MNELNKLHTCYDCMYYEHCNKLADNYPDAICGDFELSDDYIKLPCHMGDIVRSVLGDEGEVTSIRCVSDDIFNKSNCRWLVTIDWFDAKDESWVTFENIVNNYTIVKRGTDHD